MATINDVAGKLLKLSQNGKVRWKASAAAHTFVASFGAMSVIITASDHGYHSSTPYWYKLTALDDKGDELDALDSTHKNSTDLESIYNIARRTALNADEKLQELIDAMEAAQPV